MIKDKHGIIRHTLPRPHGLIECETVYDIGCGIRPFNWYEPKRRICVEPSYVYSAILEKAGYFVHSCSALEFLKGTSPVECIYMLDVIEHIGEPEAWEVIKLVEEKTERQSVIYTPQGECPQTEDGWGLGEDELQTHRSTWYDFEFRIRGWETHRYGKGFYALLTV